LKIKAVIQLSVRPTGAASSEALPQLSLTSAEAEVDSFLEA
jgi:hypothetical protein